MDVALILPMGDDDRAGVPVSYRDISAMARDAEAAGLAALWVYDHLLGVEDDGTVNGPWEAWTLLSAIAAETSRVRLGTLVSCTSFRHPALLAKMAHTVHEISTGRLVLGLGAGWNEPEYTAFGYPFDHRASRFAEAIEIITTLLRDGRTTYAGKYYEVKDCVLKPDLTAAATPPEILVGSRGEKVLRLMARFGDAWNGAWYGLPGDRFFSDRDKVHAACAAENRDPATIRMTVGMVFGGDDDKPGRVDRSPAAIADAFAAWRAEGVAEVICSPFPSDPPSVAALYEGFHQFQAG